MFTTFIGANRETLNFVIVAATSVLELVITVACLVLWYGESLVPLIGTGRVVTLFWMSSKPSLLMSLASFAVVGAVYLVGGRKRFWIIPFLLAFNLCITSFFYLSGKFFLSFMEAGAVKCMRLTVLWGDTLLLALISIATLILVLPGVWVNLGKSGEKEPPHAEEKAREVKSLAGD